MSVKTLGQKIGKFKLAKPKDFKFKGEKGIKAFFNDDEFEFDEV